jgi:carboxymethylenebutenolidase
MNVAFLAFRALVSGPYLCDDGRHCSWIARPHCKLPGPALLIWGGLDKHIKPEHRRSVVDALSETGKAYVNVEFSKADHAFFCDDRSAYEPTAARQSWALTLEFLRS